MSAPLFDFGQLPGFGGSRAAAAILEEGRHAALRHVAPDPLRAIADAARPTLFNADGSFIGHEAYCRLITPAYRWDWPHLRYIDAALDRVTRGELNRVILEMPPRHGKSEKVTVRYANQRLEINAATRIITTAYNDTLARKFSRKIRKLARGRVELSRERQAAEEWETVNGGGVRAVGLRSGVTGFGADLFLIDDPVKNRREADSQAFRDAVWESYTDDITTRLEPGSAIIITMTRWHEDDLVGRILASDDGPNWTVVKLAALAEENDPLGRPVGAALCPDRYDEKRLQELRSILGERSFNALFQQRPAPMSGEIFKREWFKFYTTPDHPITENGHAIPFLPPVMSSWLQSWDMAFKDHDKNDKVAGLVASRLGANIYLRDGTNARRDFVQTLAEVRRIRRSWPDAVLTLIEDKANGPAAISSLRNELPGLVPVEPDGSKVARAYAVTPYCEGGNVWLPHPHIAPWVAPFLLQLMAFPHGTEDDWVDAFTQMMKRVMDQLKWFEPLRETGSGQPSEAFGIANTKY